MKRVWPSSMAPARIERRFLVAFLVLVAAVLVPAAVLLDRRVGEDVRDLVRGQLEREARVLAAELERSPPGDLPSWVAERSRETEARLTVIAPDGRALGDSEVEPAALSRLENGAPRPEVIAALAGHIGSSVRRSETQAKDMMYAALPVGTPPRLVLRVAEPLDQVRQTMARADTTLLVTGLITAILAIGIGSLFARWMSRPIFAMTHAARAMSQGDFRVQLPEPDDDELGDLAIALDALRNQLAARIEQLAGEGEKLRTILNGMTEGVALVQDGAFTVANPAFSELLGVSRAIEGRTVMEVVRAPALVELVELAAAKGQTAARELQLADRWLMIASHPIGRAAQKQILLVLTDMTQHKRLERLRRDFVANASHELRTPVAAIVGAAETLSAGAAEDPAARSSFIEILLRHAERLTRLTADLLDLARLEGGYRPRVESVSAITAVETVTTTLRSRAQEEGIELATEVAPEIVLEAERAAVEQILTNLIDNAIKFCARAGRVVIRARVVEGRVELVVEDNGPGISAQHLPRLFERFYRVDAARSRELGGTGLGLAIVKHLALANQGDVRVESVVGTGSRFIVSLPRG